MANRTKAPRRRSAREWARLVAAWKKSGKSAADFAAARGVGPGTLTWWKWKLASRTVAPAEELRLVAVEIAPAATATATTTEIASPAWEITSAHGDVLRVYRGIAPAELAAVLSALRTSGEHR
jgi:transposase